MRHEDYKQLLALEALGALDADERRTLEEHLSSCDECRAELRELCDASASLAYTVAPVVPPPALRARVLERVRAIAPLEAPVTSSTPFVDPSEAFNSARGASAVDERERRPAASVATEKDVRSLLSRFSLWQLLTGRPSLGFGAACAVALLVLLGATTLALWSRNESLSAEVARLSARLTDSQRELGAQREQLASARDVNDFLASPGARVTQLAGKPPAPQARAMLAYDRSTGRAVMIASGLPPAPAGHAYQLWLIADNKPLPGGTFKTDPEGRARMSDHLPVGINSPTFAVTLEREGGESAPKGDMYLLGSAS
jgi:anti-sigma-K factor RskA